MSAADLCYSVFKLSHIGRPRSDAVAAALAEVDCGMAVESYTVDVTSSSGEEALMRVLRDEEGQKKVVSLVLLFSEDSTTRSLVNRLCLAAQKPLLAACAADNAMSGVLCWCSSFHKVWRRYMFLTMKSYYSATYRLEF